MKRDFLGIGGRNSRAFVMEESRGGRLDSAFTVGSAVHWPFLNKASELENLMSFDTSGEDDRKKIFFDPLSSTGLQPTASIDAFKASNKAFDLKALEKILGMERHGITQFSMHASQNQTMDAYCASTRRLNDNAMSRSSIPIAMTSPFLKSHCPSNNPNPSATAVKQQPFGSVIANNTSLVKDGVGAFTPRNMPKPHMKNEQLTIFYAGSVNVYDDVPSHMAQAIMLMASQECKTAINAVNPTAEAPALTSLSKRMVFDGLSVTTQTLNNAGNHVQRPCSQTKSGSGPMLTDDKAGAKSMGARISTSQKEPSKTTNTSVGSATIMPRAVPQARKASLARFLEKRKERVSNLMPYSCEKKTPDSSIVLECGSWSVGQTKSCSDSDDSPSTKLEM